MKAFWWLMPNVASIAIIIGTVLVAGESKATWIGIAGGGLSAFIFMWLDATGKERR